MKKITPEMARHMKAAKRREVYEADMLDKLLQVAAMMVTGLNGPTGSTLRAKRKPPVTRTPLWRSVENG